MILVIGGHAQGKLDYVRGQYGPTEEEIGCVLGENRIVNHLEKIVYNILEQDGDPLETVLAHADAHPDAIYLCDEVGSGVVPVDQGQRRWREAVGRCCTALACRARRVERVFCGLAMVLKECEEEP